MTYTIAADVVRLLLLDQGFTDFMLQDTGGGCLCLSLQVDDTVYVVGQDTFDVAAYGVAEWWHGGAGNAPLVECPAAALAAGFLRHAVAHTRLFHCGGCGAPIHVKHTYTSGVTPCAFCADGGVDHAHAHRHVGDD